MVGWLVGYLIRLVNIFNAFHLSHFQKNVLIPSDRIWRSSGLPIRLLTQKVPVSNFVPCSSYPVCLQYLQENSGIIPKVEL